MIRDVAIIPSGRWLLPVDSSDWKTSEALSDGWNIISDYWTSGPIAKLNVNSGQITLSGVSRGDDRFVAIALIGPSGFVHDPFADDFARVALQVPPVIITGLDWPSRLLPS